MSEQEQEATQSIQPELVPEVQADKKPTRVILLVILGLVLVAGAVYAGMQVGKRQVAGGLLTKVTPTSISQPTQIPTSIPTPDETANWKTYISEKRQFSFQYPVLWSTTDKLLHIGGDNLDVAIESKTGDELVVLSQPEGFGASPDEGLELTPIIIGGISGEKNISSGLITVRVKKGNLWYLISYKFDELQKDVKTALFDQILSTFKFLPEESLNGGTKDWKTFDNSQSGFTYKYPPNWEFLKTMEGVPYGVVEKEGTFKKNSFYVSVSVSEESLDQVINFQKNYSVFSTAGWGDNDPEEVGNKEISVDGKAAKEFTFKLKNPKELLYNKLIRVFLPNKKGVIIFCFDGNDEEVFRKILSTFKFTD